MGTLGHFETFTHISSSYNGEEGDTSIEEGRSQCWILAGYPLVAAGGIQRYATRNLESAHVMHKTITCACSLNEIGNWEVQPFEGSDTIVQFPCTSLVSLGVLSYGG